MNQSASHSQYLGMTMTETQRRYLGASVICLHGRATHSLMAGVPVPPLSRGRVVDMDRCIAPERCWVQIEFAPGCRFIVTLSALQDPTQFLVSAPPATL